MKDPQQKLKGRVEQCRKSQEGTQYEETLSTLRFAERAKKVAIKARINLDASALRILELEARIRELEEKLARCVCGGVIARKCCAHTCVERRRKWAWWQRLFNCSFFKLSDDGTLSDGLNKDSKTNGSLTSISATSNAGTLRRSSTIYPSALTDNNSIL